jgi:hypothetical protein
MSLANAWEVTDEDIQQVCFKHGWEANSQNAVNAVEIVDRDEVAKAVLEETDFDKQVDIALSNIEDQLIAAELVTGAKIFTAEDSNGPEFEVVVGNVGNVYKGKDAKKAKAEYDYYVAESKGGKGRAGNQEVTLFNNSDPEEEYQPPSDNDDQ